jgi:hypothetical protein
MSIGVYTFLQGKNLLMREIRIWEGIGENTFMNSEMSVTSNRRPSLRGELRPQGAMNRSNPSSDASMVFYRQASLRPDGLPRSTTSLLLSCSTRNDGNRVSHHFNHDVYHVCRVIHHINVYVSKTSFNFESK